MKAMHCSGERGLVYPAGTCLTVQAGIHGNDYMQHTFDVEIAALHGVDIAVLINNFRFWIGKNAANKRNWNDGRYWTHNTVKAFEDLFPYWNGSKIKRLLKKMEDDGILVSGSFNRSGFDRTKWYAFSDLWVEKFPELLGSKMDHRVDENGQWSVQNRTMECPVLDLGVAESELSYTDNYPDSYPDSYPDKEFSASGDTGCEKKPVADFFLTKKKRKLTGKRLETFLRFWKAFNFAKGKAEAADSWLDIPQLTDSLVELICAAASREAANRPNLIAQGTKPKWAQGWISARRWEDEDICGSNLQSHSYEQKAIDYIRKHGWEAWSYFCSYYEIPDPEELKPLVEGALNEKL